ncbi:hypothetical protein C8P63_11452 [Melghirimyces profundicolus]|uniref:Uncharacterized protein n=1 Tax=Melghirimyces profundicolus TaxID=1242148 RepID=A0A2T6BS15_9BACL|nr:hypothetical protein [Melghirimyces profundicolus]PTX58870.1 hypothetical protein C8P63_11452 [Melghirimyces profundicolus]
MIQHDVPHEMGDKVTDMAVNCGRLFQQAPGELARIAGFVEREMKGQNLQGASRNRDEFVAATFERIYPMVLSSKECRQAVENMMKNHSRHHGQDLELTADNPQYAIGPALAEALYLTGSAVMGSILMVTSGESGGSIEQRHRNH